MPWNRETAPPREHSKDRQKNGQGVDIDLSSGQRFVKFFLLKVVAFLSVPLLWTFYAHSIGYFYDFQVHLLANASRTSSF